MNETIEQYLDLINGSYKNTEDELCDGYYPTINSFQYNETSTFTRIEKKPLVQYVQHTFHPINHTLMHMELGLIKFIANGTDIQTTLQICQASGLNELCIGTIQYTNNVLTLHYRSESLQRSSLNSGRVTQGVERIYKFTNNTLEFNISMSTDTTTDMTPHLHGTLRKSK